jgi:hypothetical protein
MLSDIGLSRADVEREFAPPLWRGPHRAMTRRALARMPPINVISWAFGAPAPAASLSLRGDQRDCQEKRLGLDRTCDALRQKRRASADAAGSETKDLAVPAAPTAPPQAEA